MSSHFFSKDRLFCIAEIGVNHNGDIAMAKKLIDAAAEAKADAVKFQTYRTEDLVIRETPMAAYQIQNLKSQDSQWAMLKRYELDFDQHLELQQHARSRKMIFLSTPHSGESSLALLEKLGLSAYKIGSGDLTNILFLSKVGGLGKPIMLSTGMGTLNEVKEAVATLQTAGTVELMVMQCTSEYPCPPEHVNLLAMNTMAEIENISVGFSDHSTGVEAGILAVRLGALCLEKHITLDRGLPGPDHAASLEPDEFKNYVRLVKAEKAGTSPYPLDERLEQILRGSPEKKPTSQEKETAQLVRKSVTTARELLAGTKISEQDIKIRRPATGIPAKDLLRLLGRTVKTDTGYALRFWRTTQSAAKCMYQLYKIENGVGTPLNDQQVLTGVFKPSTQLTMKVTGTTLTVTAKNNVDNETLTLQGTITPNRFGGAGVFWPGGSTNTYSQLAITYPK